MYLDLHRDADGGGALSYKELSKILKAPAKPKVAADVGKMKAVMAATKMAAASKGKRSSS